MANSLANGGAWQHLALTVLAPYPSAARLWYVKRDLKRAPFRRDLSADTRGYGVVATVLAGRVEVRLAGQTRRIGPGEAVLLVAGEDQVDFAPTSADEASDQVLFGLQGPSAISLLRDLIARHGHMVRLPAEMPAVSELVALLPQSGYRHRVIDAASAMRMAADLLAMIATEQTGNRQPDLVMLAQKTWLQRLADPPTVPAMARRLGVSPANLTRHFIAACGLTPARWLRQQRLAQAAARIDAGESAATASRASGFASTAHFFRLFKRTFGQAPGAWRQRRDGDPPLTN